REARPAAAPAARAGRVPGDLLRPEHVDVGGERGRDDVLEHRGEHATERERAHDERDAERHGEHREHEAHDVRAHAPQRDADHAGSTGSTGSTGAAWRPTGALGPPGVWAEPSGAPAGPSGAPRGPLGATVPAAGGPSTAASASALMMSRYVGSRSSPPSRPSARNTTRCAG